MRWWGKRVQPHMAPRIAAPMPWSSVHPPGGTAVGEKAVGVLLRLQQVAVGCVSESEV